MRAVLIMRFTLVPAFVAASILSGCGKDEVPTKPPPGGGAPVYPILSSPQNVLAALREAYSHRDSMETKALYDSSYAGTSEDMNDGSFLQFDYSDEVRHVAALARTPTITSIRCDLGSPLSWTRLESSDPSHPEWAVIQIAGSNISVEVTDADNMLHTGSSLFFEFAFKPSTPESTSPTDTLWKIVRWRETKAGYP